MVDLARIMYFRAVRHSIDYFFVLASVHSMRSAWQHVREIVADSVFVWDIKQVRDICTRNIIFLAINSVPKCFNGWTHGSQKQTASCGCGKRAIDL